MTRPSLLVPLYVYPTPGAWCPVIQGAQAFPTVKVIAIINPASGPGAAADPNYTEATLELFHANVEMLGYVTVLDQTNTLRPVAAVEADMLQWAKLYPHVSGFFLDQVPSSGIDNYLAQVDAYAKGSAGGQLVIGNPGTTISGSYVGLLNSFVTYEGPQAILPPPSPDLPITNFGFLMYAVSALSISIPPGFGYVFLSDQRAPTPWNTMSGLIWATLKALAAIV